MANTITPDGLALIRDFEWVGETSRQQADGAWVVGYGHTEGVGQDTTVPRDAADRLLTEDLAAIEAAVAPLIGVPVNDNEYSAIISLVFNIGVPAFKKSLLRKHLNNGRRLEAAEAFMWWNRVMVEGELRVVEGLTERRGAEIALFLTPPVPVRADETSAAGLHQSTRIRPPREMPARKPLSQSRTMRGVIVAALAGAVTFLENIALVLELVDSRNPIVRDIFTFFAELPQWVYLAAAGLMVLASLYIAYARIDDWRKGRR